MAGLQRSAVSFRRQGSSGLVWEDRFLSGELKESEAGQDQKPEGIHGSEEENQTAAAETATMMKALRPINTVERSRSNGGARGYRTGRVSPAIEPPSPKVSACGFCSAFGKPVRMSRRTKPPPKPVAGGKRRSR